MKKNFFLFYLLILILAFPAFSQEEKTVNIKCTVYWLKIDCPGGITLKTEKYERYFKEPEKIKNPLINSSILLCSLMGSVISRTQTDSSGSFFATLPYGEYLIRTNALDSLVEPECQKYISAYFWTFSEQLNLTVDRKEEYQVLFGVPQLPCCNPENIPE